MSNEQDIFYLIFIYNESNCTSKLLYSDKSKAEAFENFNIETINQLNQKTDKVYFIGFNTASEFYSVLIDRLYERINSSAEEFPGQPHYASFLEFEDYTKLIAKMDTAFYAACLTTYTPFSSRAFVKTRRCSNDKCWRPGPVYRTAYGEYLCSTCYDSYMHTEKGLVEYAIGIENGTYLLSEFTEDEQDQIRQSLEAYKQHLDLIVDAPEASQEN